MTDDTDDTVSLKEIWGAIPMLSDDVQRWLIVMDETPEGDAEGEEFVYRMLLRTAVAVIEGITFRVVLQASVVGSAQRPDFISQELAKFYEFDENGIAAAPPERSGMLEAIRFGFHAYAQAHDSDYSLGTPDDNWEVIDDIAGLHQQLVAPGRVEDLVVTEEDFVKISRGIGWFLKRWHELLFKCGHALIETTPLQGPVM